MRLSALPHLIVACVLLPAAARAQEPTQSPGSDSAFDLELDLWETSGLVTDTDAYLNQFTINLQPSYALGARHFKGTWAEPLSLGARLTFDTELAGNDPAYRGRSYASPALFGELPRGNANTAGQAALDAPGSIEGAERRSNLSDLWLSTFHDHLWTVPGAGLRVQGGLRVVLPTSRASRTATLYAQPSLYGGLARTFGPVELSWGLRASKFFYGSKVAPIRHIADPVLVNGQEVEPWRPESSGSPNPEFSFAHSVSASMELPEDVSVSLAWSLFDTWSYALEDCTVPGVATANPCRDGPVLGDVRRGRANASWFMASVDWKPLPWATLGLSLSTFQPLRGLDGSLNNPFLRLTRENFSTLSLSMGVSAQALTKAFRK